MNRIIKFKAISIDTGEWVYGDLLKGQLGTRIVEEIDTPPTMQDPCGGVEYIYHRVYDETVCQFSGLYDNTKWDELTEEEQRDFIEHYHSRPEEWKGREVYEGDIIQIVTRREWGFMKDGQVINRTVGYGDFNPDNDVISEYLGFWVEMDIYKGSLHYEIDFHKAKVVKNIYDGYKV